jgi:filamin
VYFNTQLVPVNPPAEGLPDGSKCVASGSGLSRATAGSKASFVIQAVDARGVYMATGGSFFTVELTYAADYYLLPSKDNSDGTYSVNIDVTRSAPYQLSVSFGGVPVSGSPFRVNVLPAAVSLEHTSVSGNGLTAGTAGAMGSFEISARDRFSNPQYFPAGSVEFSVRVQGPVMTQAAVRRVSNGAYAAFYTLTASGTYALHVDVQSSAITIGPKNLLVSLLRLCMHACCSWLYPYEPAHERMRDSTCLAGVAEFIPQRSCIALRTRYMHVSQAVVDAKVFKV